MENKSSCLVCGKPLKYFKGQRKMVCTYCRKEFDSNASCTGGHYVCDRCHSASANELIESTCIASESRAPLELANLLMKSSAVKMHGPEHHFLVPAVLLATYLNTIGSPGQKDAKLKEARKRAENVLGGFCGFCGDCGAAVGTGIFISVLTGATPLSVKEWRMANLMTARSLQTIAMHGGPRCCKRNSFLAIIEAADFVKENFGVELKTERKQKCGYAHLNKECLKNECPYFGAGKKEKAKAK